MSLVLKRIFDIISASILFLILLPLFLFISIAIVIDSSGPIFFKQERLTKNGRVFKMFKFRSMIVNAEKMGSGLFNYEKDPRVTKVGRFLRKTSLDELPQLINIIIGDMSVIGPRPCVRYELGDFSTLNDIYMKRFSVKAGLTGWAQVKGRNNISWYEKVLLDNAYVISFRDTGILIDLKILILSIIKVFSKEDIFENKVNTSLSDEENAKVQEHEIIKMAHMTIDELNQYVLSISNNESRKI